MRGYCYQCQFLKMQTYIGVLPIAEKIRLDRDYEDVVEWYDEQEKPNVYQCGRYPPVYIGHSFERPPFDKPIVDLFDNCGEFKKRPPMYAPIKKGCR